MSLLSFVCLFVCFGVYRPTREFFTQMETSPIPVKGANFDLCSALLAIEQWGFFSGPHLLWHWASVYDGNLRGPLTPLSRLGFEPPTFRLRGQLANTLRHRIGLACRKGPYGIFSLHETENTRSRLTVEWHDNYPSLFWGHEYLGLDFAALHRQW